MEQEEQTRVQKEMKDESTMQTEEKLSGILKNDNQVPIQAIPIPPNTGTNVFCIHITQVPIHAETTMQTEEKLSGILKNEKKFSLMEEREGLTELSLEKQP